MYGRPVGNIRFFGNVMLRQEEGLILCECVSFSRGLVEALKRNMEVTVLVAGRMANNF